MEDVTAAEYEEIVQGLLKLIIVGDVRSEVQDYTQSRNVACPSPSVSTIHIFHRHRGQLRTASRPLAHLVPPLAPADSSQMSLSEAPMISTSRSINVSTRGGRLRQ